MLDKKGDETTTTVFFTAAGLLLAAVLGLAFVAFAKDAIDINFLQKNYLARDIGLLIDTIYGAPGDVVYVYDLTTLKSTQIIGNPELPKIKIMDGVVEVAYPGGSPARFRYAEDENFVNPKYESDAAPARLAFIKIGNNFVIAGEENGKFRRDDGREEIRIIGE
ncbi:hypothetical protein J4475_01170 [Candidatus Woesearchaeota archaeon]|nr:hypothetical protein [Candidatus Woesearchaeota archaeon]